MISCGCKWLRVIQPPPLGVQPNNLLAKPLSTSQNRTGIQQRYRDSNPEFYIQSVACYQLHHVPARESVTLLVSLHKLTVHHCPRLGFEPNISCPLSGTGCYLFHHLGIHPRAVKLVGSTNQTTNLTSGASPPDAIPLFFRSVAGHRPPRHQRPTRTRTGISCHKLQVCYHYTKVANPLRRSRTCFNRLVRLPLSDRLRRGSYK